MRLNEYHLYLTVFNVTWNNSTKVTAYKFTNNNRHCFIQLKSINLQFLQVLWNYMPLIYICPCVTIINITHTRNITNDLQLYPDGRFHFMVNHKSHKNPQGKSMQSHHTNRSSPVLMLFGTSFETNSRIPRNTSSTYTSVFYGYSGKVQYHGEEHPCSHAYLSHFFPNKWTLLRPQTLLLWGNSILHGGNFRAQPTDNTRGNPRNPLCRPFLWWS